MVEYEKGSVVMHPEDFVLEGQDVRKFIEDQRLMVDASPEEIRLFNSMTDAQFDCFVSNDVVKDIRDVIYKATFKAAWLAIDDIEYRVMER